MNNWNFSWFLVVFVVSLFVNGSHSYCCHCGFGHWTGCCGCNIFSCNCDYKGDGNCWCFNKGEPNKCWNGAGTYCHPWWHYTSYRSIDDNTASINGPKEIFNTLDKNEDGFISREEMEKSTEYFSKFNYSQSNGFSSGFLNVTDVLNSLDLNNDGLIQPVEVDVSLGETGKETRFKKYLLVDLEK